MNISKKRSVRQWLKWHQSGSVSRPTFPEGTLSVGSICTHYSGPAKGFQTLCLGSKVTSSGPGYRTTEPLCSIIVPMTSKFTLGKVLTKIPGNSIPIELLFPESVAQKEDFSENKNEIAPTTKTVSSVNKSAIFASLSNLPVSWKKVTLIEKKGGWSRDEVSVFVSLGTECAQLPRLPDRLIVYKILDLESVQELLEQKDITLKHVDRDDMWK